MVGVSGDFSGLGLLGLLEKGTAWGKGGKDLKIVAAVIAFK